jgi:hypothetical protein
MITAIKGVAAAVMFFLELGVLVSVAYWGFTTGSNLAVRLLAGAGAPALFAVLWGLFMAGGKAPHQLHGIARGVFEVAWFGGGALALVASGLTTAGLAFGAVYLADAALRLLLDV